MTTRETMLKMTSDHLGVAVDKISDTSNFMDDLGADSLDLVELTMAFEEEFNIVITDAETEGLTDFASAVALIEAKRG